MSSYSAICSGRLGKILKILNFSVHNCRLFNDILFLFLLRDCRNVLRSIYVSRDFLLKLGYTMINKGLCEVA